jgi:branched-chain amino acid transport system substrate-binding protein
MSPVAMYGADVPGMKPILEFNKKNSPDAVHTVRYIQGWTARMVMWEGLKRADKAGQLNGPGLKAALETLTDFDTGGLAPPITYTPTDHRPAMSATIYKMSQGKLVPVKQVSIAREDRFLGW